LAEAGQGRLLGHRSILLFPGQTTLRRFESEACQNLLNSSHMTW
jgi:hypothetical protein